MSQSDGDFLRGLDAADRCVRQGCRKAMEVVGLQILDDSINQEPRIPHDKGWLQSSGSAFVNDALVGTSSQVGDKATPVGDKATPATELHTGVGADDVMGTVGFNVPYAAHQHEGQRADGSHVVTEYSKSDGRGPKFVETKVFGNAQQYLRMFARLVRKVLGSGHV